MSLVLFEPDIPQNTGTIIRLCACVDVALHVIEPCGFPFDDKKLRRSVMDYYDLASITRHSSWQKFEAWRKEQGARLVLLSSKARAPYTAFQFQKTDMLLLGRESAGVPDHVRDAADARVTISMKNGARSLNVALAASMVLGEMVRQTT